MRQFKITQSCHNMNCIQAHDLTYLECRLLHHIVTNNYMDSDDYKAMKPSSPFLQGYENPHNKKKNDGWVLIEFWSDDITKVQAAVDYINSQFQNTERIKMLREMLSDANLRTKR